jgi:hypothetical protein
VAFPPYEIWRLHLHDQLPEPSLWKQCALDKGEISNATSGLLIIDYSIVGDSDLDNFGVRKRCERGRNGMEPCTTVTLQTSAFLSSLRIRVTTQLNLNMNLVSCFVWGMHRFRDSGFGVGGTVKLWSFILYLIPTESLNNSTWSLRIVDLVLSCTPIIAVYVIRVSESFRLDSRPRAPCLKCICDFHQPLQTNSRILNSEGHDGFHTHTFKFIIAVALT